MKIGILTFHRAYNYGAVLQCYALQSYLKSLGHDVSVIDYRQPWTESLRKVISIRKIKQLVRHPKALLIYLLNSTKRKKSLEKINLIFSEFVGKYLDIKDTCFGKSDFPSNYDCYIIGSDQLWGRSCLGGKFDDFYLGKIPHKSNSKIVGYAISSTEDSILSIRLDSLSQIVNGFNLLSFRERKIADIVGRATNNSYPTCIDPTLLCNQDIWEKIVDFSWANKQYILIYEARDSVKYPNILYQKASEIQKKAVNKLEIINLSTMEYSVRDFVSAFKFAKCVITTSFHATVFSVIFKRPFYSVKLNDGADSRYVNLLKQLGLESQCVSPEFMPSIPNIDFSKIDEVLIRYRKQSLDYLNSSLL